MCIFGVGKTNRLIMVLAFFLTLLAIACASTPLYCGHLPTLDTDRRIDPLPDDIRALNPTLLQVQTVLRHGARTPATSSFCWKGFEPHWDCEVTETSGPLLMDGRPANRSMEFIRLFDAMPHLNGLNGTCQQGQLLVEGLHQHEEMGRIFASAYLIPGTDRTVPHPRAAPLLDLTDTSWADSVYFRTTDMQRTRISGSAFLSSAIAAGGGRTEGGTLIPMHTMDLDKDYMYPNSGGIHGSDMPGPPPSWDTNIDIPHIH
eukprot:GHVO01028391.1.p1 GENE.GHVO01028391.1~~GHVO01028391.1.p1  ORF type:complete len:259 (-),score=49.66 GHVO01028391.1:202-978(-)